MSPNEGVGQLALFPELFRSPSLPSISTLPEFDRALDNLIKMSDLGAFISVNVHGLDKSYSVRTKELEIPEEFLLDGKGDLVSPVFYLFPENIRHHLRKMTYDVKSFLNSRNSFRTSFGYFLYRPYFRIWTKFVEEQRGHIERFLLDSLKGRVYGKHFLNALTQGYRFLESVRDDTAPWEFLDVVTLSYLQQIRKKIKDKNLTLHTLDKTTPDYPISAIAVKTMHFPPDLRKFVKQFSIQFTFKTIHLDYLKDVEIKSIEDVKRLSERLTKEF